MDVQLASAGYHLEVFICGNMKVTTKTQHKLETKHASKIIVQHTSLIYRQGHKKYT